MDGNESCFAEASGRRRALGITSTSGDTDLQGGGCGGDLSGSQTQFQHLHPWHDLTCVEGGRIGLLQLDQVGDTGADLRLRCDQR